MQNHVEIIMANIYSNHSSNHFTIVRVSYLKTILACKLEKNQNSSASLKLEYVINCQYVESETYSGKIIINIKLKIKTANFIKKLRYRSLPMSFINTSVEVLQIQISTIFLNLQIVYGGTNIRFDDIYDITIIKF